MYTSKSSDNFVFSLREHIIKKKKEMSESNDALNEAYARALSGGKNPMSKSTQGFSNVYLKKKDSILQYPAIIQNTAKAQEGNTQSDDRSQETKSQFTDKMMQESKMGQLCLNSVVLDMDRHEQSRPQTAQSQCKSSSSQALKRSKYVPGGRKNPAIEVSLDDQPQPASLKSSSSVLNQKKQRLGMTRVAIPRARSGSKDSHTKVCFGRTVLMPGSGASLGRNHPIPPNSGVSCGSKGSRLSTS
jgi:hypothetical protein